MFQNMLNLYPYGRFWCGGYFFATYSAGVVDFFCVSFTKEGKRKQGKRKWVGYGNANFLKEFVAMGPT